MGAREYQNTIKKIRNRYLKFGTPIYITKVNSDRYILNNENWDDEIVLDYKMISDIINVGYFHINLDLNDLPIRKKEIIIVSDFVLKKKYKDREILPIFTFIGGIICMIITINLYLGNGYSTGNITYTLRGNFPGEHSISWIHSLILGVCFLVVSAYLKLVRK